MEGILCINQVTCCWRDSDRRSNARNAPVSRTRFPSKFQVRPASCGPHAPPALGGSLFLFQTPSEQSLPSHTALKGVCCPSDSVTAAPLHLNQLARRKGNLGEYVKNIISNSWHSACSRHVTSVSWAFTAADKTPQQARPESPYFTSTLTHRKAAEKPRRGQGHPSKSGGGPGTSARPGLSTPRPAFIAEYFIREWNCKPGASTHLLIQLGGWTSRRLDSFPIVSLLRARSAWQPLVNDMQQGVNFLSNCRSESFTSEKSRRWSINLGP